MTRIKKEGFENCSIKTDMKGKISAVEDLVYQKLSIPQTAPSVNVKLITTLERRDS